MHHTHHEPAAAAAARDQFDQLMEAVVGSDLIDRIREHGPVHAHSIAAVDRWTLSRDRGFSAEGVAVSDRNELSQSIDQSVASLKARVLSYIRALILGFQSREEYLLEGDLHPYTLEGTASYLGRLRDRRRAFFEQKLLDMQRTGFVQASAREELAPIMEAAGISLANIHQAAMAASFHDESDLGELCKSQLSWWAANYLRRLDAWLDRPKKARDRELATHEKVLASMKDDFVRRGERVETAQARHAARLDQLIAEADEQAEAGRLDLTAFLRESQSRWSLLGSAEEKATIEDAVRSRCVSSAVNRAAALSRATLLGVVKRLHDFHCSAPVDKLTRFIAHPEISRTVPACSMAEFRAHVAGLLRELPSFLTVELTAALDGAFYVTPDQEKVRLSQEELSGLVASIYPHIMAWLSPYLEHLADIDYAESKQRHVLKRLAALLKSVEKELPSDREESAASLYRLQSARARSVTMTYVNQHEASVCCSRMRTAGSTKADRAGAGRVAVLAQRAPRHPEAGTQVSNPDQLIALYEGSDMPVAPLRRLATFGLPDDQLSLFLNVVIRYADPAYVGEQAQQLVTLCFTLIDRGARVQAQEDGVRTLAHAHQHLVSARSVSGAAFSTSWRLFVLLRGVQSLLVRNAAWLNPHVEAILSAVSAASTAPMALLRRRDGQLVHSLLRHLMLSVYFGQQALAQLDQSPHFERLIYLFRHLGSRFYTPQMAGGTEPVPPPNALPADGCVYYNIRWRRQMAQGNRVPTNLVKLKRNIQTAVLRVFFDAHYWVAQRQRDQHLAVAPDKRMGLIDFDDRLEYSRQTDRQQLALQFGDQQASKQQEHEAAVRRAHEAHRTEIQRLHEHYAGQREGHAADMEALRRQHVDDIREAVRGAISEVHEHYAGQREAHAEEIERLGQDHRAAVQVLKNQHVQEIRGIHEQYAGKMEAHEARVRELTEGKARALASTQKAVKERDAARGENKALKVQIADKDAQIADMGAQIADMGAQIADMGAQITDKNAQIAGMGAQITGKDAQIAGMGAQITDKDAQIADTNAQLQASQKQVSELEAENRQLQEKLTRAQDQIQASHGGPSALPGAGRRAARHLFFGGERPESPGVGAHVKAVAKSDEAAQAGHGAAAANDAGASDKAGDDAVLKLH